MKRLLAAMAVLASSGLMSAQAESCPPNVEQHLYSTLEKIVDGSLTDVTAAYERAKSTIEFCPDRSDAQAMAATVLSSIIRSQNDLNTIFSLLPLANRAVVQNDSAWKVDHSTVVVTADGSETTYYGYGHATAQFEDTILPYTLAIAGKGGISPFLTEDGLTTCPYADHGDGRFNRELDFWSETASADKQPSDAQTAILRLGALERVCTSRQADLLFTLAEVHAGIVRKLTGFEKEWATWPNFGAGAYVYSLEMEPHRQIVGEKKMLEARAEYDEIARPHAEAFKQSVAEYDEIVSAIDISSLSVNERQELTARSRTIGAWRKTMVEARFATSD